MEHSFLFWNIAKNPVTRNICSIVAANNIDELALAECSIDPKELEASLRAVATDFRFQTSDKNKIHIFARSSMGLCEEQYVDPTGNLTIRRFDLPDSPSVLMAVMHIPSKMNWSSTAQAMHSQTLATVIRQVEQDVGHERTIAVGDMNQNPYEPGLVGVQAFNAVMTRRQLNVQSRILQGREYPLFYNRMWQFFGDQTPRPSGTFYHRSLAPDSHAWNTYDQVLVRKSLSNHLKNVRILDSDGNGTLVNRRGIPTHKATSDHLPLLFTMNFAREFNYA